jgi:hypothetical protein
MNRNSGKVRLGGMLVVAVLALVVGLVVAVGPAAAGVVQTSPADQQYGSEQPTATAPDTSSQQPDVFQPPTVASGVEDSGGLLPFTGAALVVPSLLGGILLVGGLVLVFRTRRRED